MRAVAFAISVLALATVMWVTLLAPNQSLLS
jgi:hypothetical protein